MRARIKVLGTVAVLLSLATSACSSSSSSTAAAAGSSAATAGSSSATGSPITIGYINLEKDPIGDFTTGREAAQAAVSYLNSQGGIGGHPLKLDLCVVGGESGGDVCANQMAAAKVPLVVGGGGLNVSAQIYPILKSAGIPLLNTEPSVVADYTPDGDHFSVFGGAAATLGAMSAHIASLHPASVAAVVGNIPAGIEAIKTAVQAPLEKLGVHNVTLIPIPVNAPDYTTYINEAAKSSVIFSVLSGPTCTTWAQQLGQLQVSTPNYWLQACQSPQLLAATGAQVSHQYFGTEVQLVQDPTVAATPDGRTYLDAMKANGLTATAETQQFWSAMLVAAQLLKSAGGAQATGTTVLQAIKTAKNVPIPFSATFTCDPPSQALPTVCNPQIYIYQATGTNSFKLVS